MLLPNYGELSALALDPIEKKPLYHFYPGSSILSIGFLGCNMACPFCQNWEISQSETRTTERFETAEIIAKAQASSSLGIAYTYSEPLVHFEYVLESAQTFQKAGLKTVLVTNGYLNPKPAGELLAHIDAVNIDLKSFSHESYKNILKGGLDEVKDFILLAHEVCHLEITSLIVPGMNDGEAEIANLAQWIADIDPSIPLHMSAYHPSWKYHEAATSKNTMEKLLQLASRSLSYVYGGNLSGLVVNTLCPACSALLIDRSAYRGRIVHLKEGCCDVCGISIPVIF